MKRSSLAIFAFLIIIANPCFSNVKLPGIFGDNMVLQRNQPIPVWGWADPGEKVTVSLNGKTKSIKTDKSGKWLVKLDPESAGGPYELIVTGKNSLKFTNVLIGEVWICSGQSNMEMPINGWGKINHFLEEVAAANYPTIRHIKVPNTVSFDPKDDIGATSWKICSPATAGDFTAVGYFFAREITNRLHVPVGLINSSWGGTMVETWISKGKLEQSDEFKTIVASINAKDQQALLQAKQDKLINKIVALQGPLDKGIDFGTWKNPELDDSKWGKMNLPGFWEDQGLPDLDGVVWFRKTFVLDAADAGKPAILSLSKIDDSDDSYLNGMLVGSKYNQYSELRKYSIPANLLKAGKNVIAIRVEDTGGGGGVYGEAGDLSLSIGEKTIPLAGPWLFKVEKIAGGSQEVGPNSNPTLLYNAMIHPLLPYGIKGAIWYQGEANAGRAYQYRKTFPMLIQDWRADWNQGDFPFYFVQLASFNNSGGDNQHGGSDWAELREAQTMTLSLPNTGMAVTTDIGDSKDIHPKNKQDVGKRLAAVALSQTYGLGGEFSGPMYSTMSREGNKVHLQFTHTGKGLKVLDKYGYLKGFEVAGADKVFHYAKAEISGNEVIVYSPQVSDPQSVRYAWADDAGEANLFNEDGFPASAFRTDDWPGKTINVTYTLGE